VTPPPEVWQRIAAELPAQRAAKTGTWWEALAFWRGLAIGASGLAAASLVALFVMLSTPAQKPLTAAIEGGGRSQFVATVDVTRATIAVVPAGYAADAARVPELWLIPEGGKPISLGLVRGDRAVSVTVPAQLIAQTNSRATLAVSLEPQGGSPTGQPTGPVIGAGKLTNL
jgi:anti-sigma-K factor RskA